MCLNQLINNVSWQQQQNVIICIIQNIRLYLVLNSASRWSLVNQSCLDVRRQTRIQTADLDNLLHLLKSLLFQERILVSYKPISYFQKAFLYQFPVSILSLCLLQVIHKSVRKEHHLQPPRPLSDKPHCQRQALCQETVTPRGSVQGQGESILLPEKPYSKWICVEQQQYPVTG